jgi:group I intron endonuclease
MINTVYLLRNKINNKIYIGQTWNSFKDRYENGHGYRGNEHLYSAIKKYGKDNFVYEVLTFCGTQETADYWEIEFIKKYNSIDRVVGYNLRDGGNSGGKLSKETRIKLSIINTGKILSEDTKKKIGVSQIGNKHSLGIKMSDKNKAAMSAIHKGKPKSETQKQKMREAAIGRVHSEDTKKKMRKPKSDEAKVNISKSKIGKTYSKKIPLEQRALIKLDPRPIKDIAKDYSVSYTLIKKYKLK